MAPQAVNLPAVATATPGEVLAAPQNNPDNQGAVASFPGLLALSGQATDTDSGTTASAPVDPQAGQTLPPETLLDGNRGKILPLPAEPADTTLVVDVVVADIKTAQSQAITVASDTAEGALVAVSESDVDTSPETAILLPAQLTGASIQPVAKPLLSDEAVSQDTLMVKQPLQEELPAIRPTRQYHSPALLAQHSSDTDSIDIPAPVQSIRSMTEEVVKPLIRPADIETVVQAFRRMVAPAPGSETRSNHDISSLLAAVPSTPVTPVHNNSQPLPGLMLDTPFQKAGWDQGLTEKIQWMVGQRLQGAEIKLNPAHLGPVEVRIQMHNDQATVHFTATHGVVRDALEAAVPRLREMFDNQGIQLADVDVSEQSFTQQHMDREAGTGQHATRRVDSDAQQSHEESSGSRWTTPVSAVGRLDLFA